MLRHLLLSFVLLTNTSFPHNANSSGSNNPYKLSTTVSFAQNTLLNSSGFDSTYKLKLRNPVQDKNFYLLSLFQQNPEVAKTLKTKQSPEKAIQR